MDLSYYRQREQAERLAADQARDPKAREVHLQLAVSYRSVIEAYERLDAIRPAPRSVA